MAFYDIMLVGDFMIGNNWDIYLKEVYQSNWYQELMAKVELEYKTKIVYPIHNNLFNALRYTDYNNTKIIIIGQDPYHGPFEAHGFAFSVQEGIKIPPSLKNIFKELESDMGIKNTNGDLRGWAKEGVLLLNAVLTVEKDKPLSHHHLGWEKFTDSIIKILNQKEEPLVFILWGVSAKKKHELITNPKHLVLTSTHPSPFSAHNGFFGSKPFSKANEYLIKNGIKPVNFQL